MAGTTSTGAGNMRLCKERIFRNYVGATRKALIAVQPDREAAKLALDREATAVPVPDRRLLS